jgi:hypothetical protein
MAVKETKQLLDYGLGLGTGANFFIFASCYLVVIAQLVRASDCGSEGRGFEPHWPPQKSKASSFFKKLFLFH